MQHLKETFEGLRPNISTPATATADNVEADEAAFLSALRRLYATGDFDLVVCLIQRKHSISFEAFVRGKYNNSELQTHKNRMTRSEREAIQTTSWEDLYRMLMSDKDARYMQRERRRAKALYDTLDLQQLFQPTDTVFEEPNWELPKGRRFVHETDRQCALREFYEETNIQSSEVMLLEDRSCEEHSGQFCEERFCEERFCGTNKRMYFNKYYVGMVHPLSRGPYVDPENPNQTSEVKAARYYTLPQALALLRPFHNEKRSVLEESHRIVLEALEAKN